MADKCYCGRPANEVSREDTPCCHKPLCWDYCLYNHMDRAPFKCPYCGKLLRVANTAEEYEGAFDGEDVLEEPDELDARYAVALMRACMTELEERLTIRDFTEKPELRWARRWLEDGGHGVWPLEAPPMKEPDREE